MQKQFGLKTWNNAFCEKLIKICCIVKDCKTTRSVSLPEWPLISTELPSFSKPLHPDSCIPRSAVPIIFLLVKANKTDRFILPAGRGSPASMPVSKIVSIYRREDWIGCVRRVGLWVTWGGEGSWVPLENRVTPTQRAKQRHGVCFAGRHTHIHTLERNLRMPWCECCL